MNLFFLGNFNFFLSNLDSKDFTPRMKFPNLTIDTLLGAFFEILADIFTQTFHQACQISSRLLKYQSVFQKKASNSMLLLTKLEVHLKKYLF